MLPKTVLVEGVKIKLKGQPEACRNLDYIMYRTSYQVAASIKRWLQVPLDEGFQERIAVLMFNLYEVPIWMHPGQGQGVGETRKTIRACNRALKLLRDAKKLEQDWYIQAAQLQRNRAKIEVDDLQPPVSFWISNACLQGEAAFEEVLEHIKTLHLEYLKIQSSHRGHMRARRIALSLRAIFEEYSDIPVKAGVTQGIPQGVFSRCLQETSHGPG